MNSRFRNFWFLISFQLKSMPWRPIDRAALANIRLSAQMVLGFQNTGLSFCFRLIHVFPFSSTDHLPTNYAARFGKWKKISIFLFLFFSPLQVMNEKVCFSKKNITILLLLSFFHFEFGITGSPSSSSSNGTGGKPINEFIGICYIKKD